MNPSNSSPQDTSGVIARPSLIYLAFLIAGVALDFVWPTHLVATSFPLRVGLGASLGLFGSILCLSGVGQLRHAKTDSNPGRPSATLVVEGPYRFTRNPMYLGFTLIYGGVAFGANNAWLLGLLVPLLLLMHFGVITREEAYLERKFGESYRNYRKTVRRWF